MDQFNLNRQAAKDFMPGDIVENEDGSPFTDPHSDKKYQRVKIQSKLMDRMILKPVDESGQVVEGRYNDIHIQPAQYSSLKIVVPWNSRNLRRRRNEMRAAEAAARAAELERDRALLATFRVGQQVGYTLNDYDNYMGQQGALLGTYRFPATILEIISGSPPRAQIRYDAADSQPPAPGWVARGVVTKTVSLKELGRPPTPMAFAHTGHLDPSMDKYVPSAQKPRLGFNDPFLLPIGTDQFTRGLSYAFLSNGRFLNDKPLIYLAGVSGGDSNDEYTRWFLEGPFTGRIDLSTKIRVDLRQEGRLVQLLKEPRRDDDLLQAIDIEVSRRRAAGLPGNLFADPAPGAAPPPVHVAPLAAIAAAPSAALPRNAPPRNVNEDPAPPSPGGGTRKSKRSKRKTRRRRAI